MRKSKAIVIMMLGMMCFTACENQDLSNERTETKSIETQSTENVQQEETNTEQERLKTTDFNNLSKVAEKVGFSFRAVESLDADDDENNSFKFQNFSISTEKETEINGMQLDDPSYVVTLTYKKQGLIETKIRMFKNSQENIQSAIHDPACYVSTEKINGLDVGLAEYIIRIMPKDYDLTEEDQAFIDSGKGSISQEGNTREDAYFRSLYWIQDGIYYELDVREYNFSLDSMKEMVRNIMKADIK